MAINVIHNDPKSGSGPVIHGRVPAIANNFGIGFKFGSEFPQREYDRETERDGFLHWQCRQSALMALRAWRNAATSKITLKSWYGGQSHLLIRENAGRDLNAYYNRSSLSFFNFTTGGKTTFSGESTDVVAHEVGHALLDAYRPDLWNTTYFEVGAFHEAVGDCSALMAALEDPDVRKRVLQNFRNRQSNLIETIAEDLADGIDRHSKTLPEAKQKLLRNAGAPRRAKNRFARVEPSTLPRFGKRGELIYEVHSYSQIFTGCFYDLIMKLFIYKKADPEDLTDSDLLSAARTAGLLLIEGLYFARRKPQFFREVGQYMIFADKRLHGGIHQVLIRDIFLMRDMQLHVEDILSAEQSLDGAVPDFDAPSAAEALSAPTKKDLRKRLGIAPTTSLNYEFISDAIQGQRFVEVSHKRTVPLHGLDRRLAGVAGESYETVRVGELGGAPQVLGTLPNPTESDKEVLGFVKGLMEGEMIAFDRQDKAAARETGQAIPTHSICKTGENQSLRRLRFACGC